MQSCGISDPGLSDGQKVVLAVEPGYRESAESWGGVLRDLKQRGMNSPRLVVGDGHLGIWGALRNIYPAAEEQRCWNHKIVNVLDKLPRKAQVEAKGRLQKIAYSQSLKEAEGHREQFLKWCQEGNYQRAAATLERDWDRMVTFYNCQRTRSFPLLVVAAYLHLTTCSFFSFLKRSAAIPPIPLPTFWVAGLGRYKLASGCSVKP